MLVEIFSTFFASTRFMPHIHCYLDNSFLVWSMFLTDFFIGCAYIAISLILWALIRKNKVPFSLVILCFGLFIGACGATHFMEVWTLWHPDYWVAAFIKLLTAVASVGTALYLYRLRHAITHFTNSATVSEQRRLELESLTKTLETRILEGRAELTQTASILHTVMTSTADLIYMKDRQSRMLYCNPTTLSLIGKSEDEIYGKTDVEFLGAGKGGEEILKIDEEIMTSNTGSTAEEFVTWKDGTKRIYMSQKRPHLDASGNVIGIIGISRDITELKKNQAELEEAIKARDEFLSVASHELQTPLTTLKLQAQLMKRAIKKGDESGYSKKQVELLTEQTDRQATRLSRLVDDMLDIAQIRSGKLTFKREHFDICDLVKDSVERLSPQFINAGYDQPKLVLCRPSVGFWDKMRIEQVVANLFTNAIKYGGKKTVAVQVERSERHVRILVKDQGIGITPESQAKIFNRFERAVSSSEVSGLGLGLFISREIVSAHGGTIWVESKIGEGSTFFVELPITVESEKNESVTEKR